MADLAVHRNPSRSKITLKPVAVVDLGGRDSFGGSNSSKTSARPSTADLSCLALTPDLPPGHRAAPSTVAYDSPPRPTNSPDPGRRAPIVGK
jgi:hypothetical protein